jgi:beta-phosphoglucomutase-like phosphatase (HAD superfamily)
MAKPHKINFDEPALRALDAQKLRNFSSMFEKYKSFVFDCDGVILDSNSIKTEAFRKALADEPGKLVDEFIQYHKDNGGVSRYIKLQYYFDEIKKQQDSEQALANALTRYAEIVREDLLKASMIEGIEGFLYTCQKNKRPCFVNSGGDQQELREVFSERGLDHFFSMIFGSPASKKENLEKMLIKEMLPEPVLFFGDAYSDYLAAKAYEIDFVYVSGKSEWTEGCAFSLRNGITVIDNFNSRDINV